MTTNIPDDILVGIEDRLRQDIAWQVNNGGFDGGTGAIDILGKWQADDSGARGGTCATCAIGSYLLHRQPGCSGTDVETFAACERIDVEWARELYFAVATLSESPNGYFYANCSDFNQQVLALAKRLVEWAQKCEGGAK